MIKVWLKETAQHLVYENAKNTYQKGSFYCIYADEKVVKIPIDNIFKIEESYNF